MPRCRAAHCVFGLGEGGEEGLQAKQEYITNLPAASPCINRHGCLHSVPFGCCSGMGGKPRWQFGDDGITNPFRARCLVHVCGIVVVEVQDNLGNVVVAVGMPDKVVRCS